MTGVRPAPDGCLLDVRLVPNARGCSVERGKDGWRVRVDARPVEGAANARLVEYLAREVFEVSRSKVTLLRGEHSRDKTLSVALPPEEVERRLTLASGIGG